MLNSSILILLYNKQITESKTLSSLISSDIQFSHARLVIWNNGPNKLSSYDVSHLEDLGYEVVVKETLNNESLAVVYNCFIYENQAEKYIFLDDDSSLNSDYIKAACGSANSIVSMPLITSGGVVVNPKVNSSVCCKDQELTSNDKILTIGSGLVLGHDIVIEMFDKISTVFDERFYLYGVDTTFCLRLKELQLISKIKLIDGFEHSMSRFEKESEEVSHFRKVERSYDFGLTLKYYYPKKKAFFEILMYMIMTLKRKLLKQPTEFSFFLIVKSFLTGKHYRNVSHGKKT